MKIWKIAQESGKSKSDLYEQMLSYFREHGVWPTGGVAPTDEDDSDYANYLESLKGPSFANEYVNQFQKHREFIDQYGFAIPSKDALEKIRTFVGGSSVLEIGSGWKESMVQILVQGWRIGNRYRGLGGFS